MATTEKTDPGTLSKAERKAARRSDNSVDSIPPLARLAPLGLQHVLAMYAGAVAVPLIEASRIRKARDAARPRGNGIPRTASVRGESEAARAALRPHGGGESE